MTKEWIINSATPRPVRDKMLVELEMPPILQRAVGTQYVLYPVPNGTKGVMRGYFYQDFVPMGLTT
jgi:hypothetical protein